MITLPPTPILPAGITSPERELLLRCARVEPSLVAQEEIRHWCRAGVDWKVLRRLAQGHQLSPLLFRSLDRVCPELVPAEQLDRMRNRFHANVAFSLQIGHFLAEILDHLEAAGIRAVTLKGPALAAQAYGEPALRAYRDLDLLVRREDVLRARTLLEAYGYEAFPKLSSVQERVFMRSECEFWFESPGEQFPLEVHWDLREAAYAYTLDVADCWQRLEQVEIGGRTVPVLGTTDTWLMLSCHAAKHRWGHLKLVCDLAELLRTMPKLDWDGLIARAAQFHGLRMLLLGFQLAGELLGAPLPDPVLRAMAADRTLPTLAGDVTAYLFADGRGGRQSLSSTRLYLRMRERWQDRLRYGTATLFTPTLEDWNSLPLPEPLFPLYSLVRPIRLLMRPLLTRRPATAAQ